MCPPRFFIFNEAKNGTVANKGDANVYRRLSAWRWLIVRVTFNSGQHDLLGGFMPMGRFCAGNIGRIHGKISRVSASVLAAPQYEGTVLRGAVSTAVPEISALRKGNHTLSATQSHGNAARRQENQILVELRAYAAKRMDFRTAYVSAG